MMVRTAWISCTAVLLSLSLSTANGPAGGFFFARHQQRSRKFVAAQVQQQPHLLLEKSNIEERLGGLRDGLGRIAWTATAAFGGTAQDSRQAVEAAQSHHEGAVPEVSGIAEDQCNQRNTHAGFGRHWRSLSSPLEALSSTSRQLSLRASASVAALGLREGLREGKQRSATLLTRGGGAPQPALQAQNGERWRNAVEGLKNGLASGLAAACVKTVLQPFDTMKTVQQFSTTR